MVHAALARPLFRAILRKVASGTNSKREEREREHYVPGGRSFCDLLSICLALLSWPCVAWKAAALFKSNGVADSQHSPYKPPVTFVCCLSPSYIYTHTHHACIMQAWIFCLSIDHLFSFSLFVFTQVCQYKSLSLSFLCILSTEVYAVLRGKDKTRLSIKSFRAVEVALGTEKKS